MMQPNITEFHTLRVFVAIKNIRLLVRFPCRLSFQLKTQNSSVQTVNTYELKKGQCDVNETVKIDFDVVFDNHHRCYQQKKVKLVVMMSSANGIIPAGMVNFNPCETQPLERSQQTLSLQKCPDRSATIKFTKWYQFLRTTNNLPSVYHSTYMDTRYTLKANNNNNKQSQLKHSTYTNQGYGRASKYSPIKRDTTPSKYRTAMGSNINGNNSINNLPVSSTHHPPATTRTGMRTISSPFHEGQMQNGQSYISPTNDYRMAQSYIQQPSYGHTASFYQMNQSAYVGGHQQPQFGMRLQPQQFESKMDFGQKASFLKQIAKLRGQVKSLQNEDKWQQLVKVKDENQTLIMQLEKYKQKYRNLQKKDRQYNMSIKQIKDQLQRMKLKQNNTQSLRTQLQCSLQQKDKKLKQSITQIKKLQQKISDMQLTLSSGQKRIQFKQSSFQQQLQKLSEKYSLSESERQKVTIQYNGLLGRMEENEKKYQLGQKQRQRLFNQQKNKLSKKVDTLNQQLQKLKQDYHEKQSSLLEVTANLKSMTKRQAQKQTKLVHLQKQLEYSQAAFRKQEEQRKTLQSEVAILRTIEEQRNILKKKYNQTLTQLTKTKQKLDHTINDMNNLTNKSRDLQLSNQQLKKQRSQLFSKINMLTKQVQQLAKTHQKKSRQHETLSAQNMNTTQRINDLRSKLQTEQRDYSQMAMQYQQQLNYLTKSKQYADAQIQDLKWSIQRHREQYEQLVQKLKQSTQQSLQLNRQILQSGDRIKRLQQQLAETKSLLKTRTGEKLSLEQKQRQYQQTIKQKSNQNYQLSKNKLQLQQQLYLLKQKLQQQQSYQKDRSLTDQKLLKQKQKQINELSQQVTKSQLQLMHLNEQISALNQSITMRNNQVMYLKDNIQLLQQKVNDLELKNGQTKQQLKSTNFQFVNLKTQKEQLTKQLQMSNKLLQKIKMQWQQYRTNTTNALEQLIQQISKDDDQTTNKQHNLLIFSDMNISSMQVQAIKKRNTVISSYRQKLSLLEKQVLLNKQSVQKLKHKLQQKDNQYQLNLSKQKQRYKQLSTQIVTERQLLTQQIRKSQQKAIQLQGQIQKQTNQIKKSIQIIQQTKSQSKQIIIQRQQLKLQIRQLQQKILQMKSYQIKIKASQQSKFSQLNDQSQQQLLKMKLLLVETERKVQLNEKIVGQKEEIIKRLQNEVTGLINERNRFQQKAIVSNEKVVNLTQQKKLVQKKVRVLEKQLKQQQQLNEHITQQLTNEKSRLQQTRLKYNQTFQLLTDSQVQNQKLKQQQQITTQTVSSLQTTLKQKQQKYKLTQQKLSTQLKQHKQKLITLNSELELKEFINKQQQDSITLMRQSLTQMKQQLAKKKSDLIKLSDQLQTKKTNILQIDQSLNMNKNQKQTLKDQNQRLRSRIIILEKSTNQNRVLEDVLETKNKQIKKLKQQLNINRRHYQQGLADIRSQSTDRINNRLSTETTNNRLSTDRINNRLSTERNSNRLSTSRNATNNNYTNRDDQQQLRKRIRQLQQLLELKHYDLALQRKKWLSQNDRQKRQLILQINQLTQQIQDLQSEFDFQRIQLNKQIQSLGQQVDDLLKLLHQKQQLIFLIQNLVKDLQNGNTSRVQQLKINVEELKKDIESRMRETSFSKDNKQRHNHSFSQDTKWLSSHPRQLQNSIHDINNDIQIPIESQYFSQQLHNVNQSNHVLNDQIELVQSQQYVPVNAIVDEIN